MAIIGWKRVKWNKTQKSDDIELNSDYCTIPDTIQDRVNPAGALTYAIISLTDKTKKKAQAHPAAGVSYASIKKTNNKTRVHNKYHKGDLWTRISAKSARALSDDNIYVNMRPK